MWKYVAVGVTTAVVVGLVVGLSTWGAMRVVEEDAPDTTTQSTPEETTTNTPSEDPPELRTLDWWEHTVIYQIYPRSFKDTDGDGIGDLKGITQNLGHLVEAGIGAIWMSPIFTSPMIDFGYDISNFYEIHDEYGTMEDFEELVEEAQRLGLKVLLDYVPNHASNESEYFRKSENREPGFEDYFVWADPKIIEPEESMNDDLIPDETTTEEPTRLVPSNWISQFGGSVWTWSEKRQQFYLHQFAAAQPDFNYREPAVVNEMVNIMTFWIEKGVHGFRVDAIPHLFEAKPDENGNYPDEPLTGWGEPGRPGYTTQEFTRDLPELYDVVYDWREAVDKWTLENDSEKVTRVLLAEAYANVPNTMLYYGDGKGRLGAHFPFNFDFITSINAESSAKDIVFIILRWLTFMPRGHVPNWVFGNHDNSRMPTRFRPNMVDGLNGLNMLLPGVAISYQGEEIGMEDGFVSWEDTVDVAAINQGDKDTYHLYSRDPCRTPFHWDDTRFAGFSTGERTWLPVADSYSEVNVAAQRAADRSHFKVYQALTSLRAEPALSHGEYRIEALSDNTLVLVRYLRTFKSYALVFNVANEPDTVDLRSMYLLKEPMVVYISSVHSSRVSGDAVPLGEITLQPGEALVLEVPST